MQVRDLLPGAGQPDAGAGHPHDQTDHQSEKEEGGIHPVGETLDQRETQQPRLRRRW